MKRFAIKVRALSPLAIRADHSPTRADVAPYIPGSTFIGSLAAAHRLLRDGQKEEFVKLFLSDKVQYPNLYPASFKNGKIQDLFSPLYCIPRTAQTCKRFKGFKPLLDDDLDDDDQHHGVRDNLFNWAIFALSDKARQATTEAEREQIISTLQDKQNRDCPCGEPLDSFDGFYRWRNNDRAAARPDKRLLTRTGINRKSGTVEDKILYSREVFEEDNIFFGIIQAEDDVADDLQKFIFAKESADEGPLLLTDFARLGTARTRGFGQVEFEIGRQRDTQDDFEAFKQRLYSFNQALHDYAQIDAHRPFYIALTLHAPTLLYDELLRYEGTISEKRLAALTGLPEDSFELLYHSASVRRIMGWQDLWGLPHTHEYALDAGSVFLFALTHSLADDKEDRLAQALFKLEERGIGQRRAEGFGRVCISDPFHTERDLR